MPRPIDQMQQALTLRTFCTTNGIVCGTQKQNPSCEEMLQVSKTNGRDNLCVSHDDARHQSDRDAAMHCMVLHNVAYQFTKTRTRIHTQVNNTKLCLYQDHRPSLTMPVVNICAQAVVIFPHKKHVRKTDKQSTWPLRFETHIKQVKADVDQCLLMQFSADHVVQNVCDS